MLTFKERYLLAKKNGEVEKFRSDEIAKEIAKTFDGNAQQALQTNMINDLINGVPFSHQAEWDKYQVARADAKKVVDAEIKECEKCTM